MLYSHAFRVLNSLTQENCINITKEKQQNVNLAWVA